MKKIAAILAVILLTSFQQQEKTVTITLTLTQANVVLNALSNLPYKDAAPIIDTIQIQAKRQLEINSK